MATNYSATYTHNHASDGTNHYGHNIHNYFGGLGNSDPQQCLRDLRVTDPREDRARIEGEKDRLLRECYAWILEDARYQRWRAQHASRLLWINGDPGKGKTMMMLGVINELSSRDEVTPSPWKISSAIARLKFSSGPHLLTYFFCQSSLPELNNAVSVLRGLIYRLIDQREDLIQHVQKQYRTRGKQLFEGPDAIYALKMILSDILNDAALAALPPTYLLIDALDECTSGLPELLSIITDSSVGQEHKVKWLVTSRNVPEIELYLHPDLLGSKVSLEVEASYVSKAVATFVKYKLQQLAPIKKYDLELQEEVQRQLCNKAEGTFLWVSLACKELGKVPMWETQKVLQALLPGLDPLYERMLEQIEAQDVEIKRYCKAILQSITLAFRPLQLSELAWSAGLPCDRFGNVKAVSYLLECSGSFLTVREGTVSFIHLSAKDYFTIGKGQQAFDRLENGHKQMAGRLIYAMNRMLKRNMCNLKIPDAHIHDKSTQELIEESNLALIAYACEHWAKHVQAGGKCCRGMLADGGEVLVFLKQHLLHWLEAMSLLQKIPEAILALQKLEADLDHKGAESATVSKLVHDALRFATWCGSGIQDAPLQVYYGALVFAPAQSIVRQQFKREMPEEVRMMLGLKADWDSLLQTLEGHTNLVTSVAFSHNSTWLASASRDGTIRIWDANSGHCLQMLSGHGNSINSITISPDSKRLASGSVDGTIKIWDTASSTCVQTLKEHSSPVNSITFSHNGETLASGLDDNTIRIWDAQTGNHRSLLHGHSTWVTSVAFSLDDKFLASASHDKTIRVWDLKTGSHRLTHDGHSSWVTSVAFSHDGEFLASASDDKKVKIWNARNLLCLKTLEGHNDTVRSAVFSTDSTRVASASDDTTVKIWDTHSYQCLRTLRHGDGVSAVAFSADSAWLASASRDKTIKIWDTSSCDTSSGKSEQESELHSGKVNFVVFSPSLDQLGSASEDSTIKIWDCNTGKCLRTLKGHAGGVNSITFSSKFCRLVSASDDNTVKIWDTMRGLLAQLSFPCNGVRRHYSQNLGHPKSQPGETTTDAILP
ncbi:hypothetical protein E8E13_002329 [Curvularia kusanoi]|uniref:NACHT domain-containing protein n=1 Tax=Curvularia kusanoi TaxID=90978 RepID=A0A9P4T585_CURKU|nr:hypothetical protein E8E13_002329 [Curvularia kusanoi]